jgi:hypothetical protein
MPHLNQLKLQDMGPAESFETGVQATVFLAAGMRVQQFGVKLLLELIVAHAVVAFVHLMQRRVGLEKKILN